MTDKMNQEWKEKWCNALESGEYPQSVGSLRSENGFCCLGVAEDLIIKQTREEWIPFPDFADSRFFSLKRNDPQVGMETASLRESTANELGLSGAYSTNPLISYEIILGVLGKGRFDEIYNSQYMTETKASLAELNDIGASFKEIAAIIREAL